MVTHESPARAAEDAAEVPDEQSTDNWGEGRLVFRRPEVGAKRSAQLDVITTSEDRAGIGVVIRASLERAEPVE
jgi:hypothetical protein